MDLIQYAGRATPPLSLDKIASYPPRTDKGKTPSGTSLFVLPNTLTSNHLTLPERKNTDIISRLHNFSDDGHAIKLGRAALICRDISKKYEGKDWIRIKGDDLWTRVCHLVVDSVEAPGPNWVRTCGLDEAWKDVPDQQDSKL